MSILLALGLILFATDIDSTEGLIGGGLLITLGAIGQFVVAAIREVWKERRAANLADHKQKRNEQREDETDTIKRYQELLDRMSATVQEYKNDNTRLQKDQHDQNDRFNSRILKLEVKVERATSQIRYQQTLLDQANIPHHRWDDSDPVIALPSEEEKT